MTRISRGCYINYDAYKHNIHSFLLCPFLRLTSSPIYVVDVSFSFFLSFFYRYSLSSNAFVCLQWDTHVNFIKGQQMLKLDFFKLISYLKYKEIKFRNFSIKNFDIFKFFKESFTYFITQKTSFYARSGALLEIFHKDSNILFLLLKNIIFTFPF